MPEDLPESILEAGPVMSEENGGAYYEAIKAAKRRIVLQALERSGGNVTAAAKQLGVHANHLHRLMRTLELRNDVSLR